MNIQLYSHILVQESPATPR